MKYVLQLIQAFRLLFNVLGSNPSFLETSVIVCPFKSSTTPTEDEACNTTKKMPKCPICDPQSTTSNDDCEIIVDDCEIIVVDCDDCDDCEIIFDSKTKKSKQHN